jgi:hypothetical protein
MSRRRTSLPGKKERKLGQTTCAHEQRSQARMSAYNSLLARRNVKGNADQGQAQGPAPGISWRIQH